MAYSSIFLEWGNWGCEVVSDLPGDITWGGPALKLSQFTGKQGWQRQRISPLRLSYPLSWASTALGLSSQENQWFPFLIEPVCVRLYKESQVTIMTSTRGGSNGSQFLEEQLNFLPSDQNCCQTTRTARSWKTFWVTWGLITCPLFPPTSNIWSI